MRRGEIWWIELGEPVGSAPGFRRPCLIVSSNALNGSALRTVLTASITSNLKYAHIPSCLRLPMGETGLSKPSVAQLTILSTVDKRAITEQLGKLPMSLWPQLDDKLRHVLGIL